MSSCRRGSRAMPISMASHRSRCFAMPFPRQHLCGKPIQTWGQPPPFTLRGCFDLNSSTILAMTTSGFPQSAGRLVAPRVIQCCIACSEQYRLRGAATAVQRSWIEGWRITCPVCRQRQEETREGGICRRKHVIAVRVSLGKCRSWRGAHRSVAGGSICRWGIANRYRPITAHQTMPKVDTPLHHPWRRRSRFR